MRVFVAGATGAIGRPLVPLLVAAGHEVTGMTRSLERAAALREAGAEAVVCDAYDREALSAAVTGAAPDVVVHQLTALPQAINVRRYSEAVAPTNKIRRVGTRHLLAAARAAGAKRFVAQSISFAYAPAGPPDLDENAPLALEAPDPIGEAARSVSDMEHQILEADGIDGLILRYGYFYGPGSPFERDGHQVAEIRRRRLPVLGKGDARWSFIHTDDAAAATVLAVERGAPGIYNIVDDEPAPMKVWLPEMARILGAKPPRRAPLWLARLVAGRAVAEAGATLRGARNDKARRALGWEPRWPSWREGFAATLGGDA